MVFLSDILFGHFNVFDNGKIVVFCHVNHVVDVLDLFVHVDRHGGYYFFDVFCSLLVVLSH